MQVQRLDVGTIKNYRETQEGFLDCWLTFSKIGPLIYQRADGSLDTEYLSEAELFDEQSLSTASGKPITYLHPSEWVNKDNARKHSRGSTSTKIIKDLPFATILATIHDGELIDVIKSGKAKQVSATYTTKVMKDSSGKLQQTGRVYNSFAVVPAGRAGSDVRVHLDSMDSHAAIQVDGDATDPHLLTRVSLDLERTRESVARQEMIYRMQKRSDVIEGRADMMISFRMSDAAAMNLKSEAANKNTTPEKLILDLVEAKYGGSKNDSADPAQSAYERYVERLKTGSRR